MQGRKNNTSAIERCDFYQERHVRKGLCIEMNRLKTKFRISQVLSSVHSCDADQFVDLRREDHVSLNCVLLHLSLGTANPVPVCALGFLLNPLKSSR